MISYKMRHFDERRGIVMTARRKLFCAIKEIICTAQKISFSLPAQGYASLYRNDMIFIIMLEFLIFF